MLNKAKTLLQIPVNNKKYSNKEALIQHTCNNPWKVIYHFLFDQTLFFAVYHIKRRINCKRVQLLRTQLKKPLLPCT